MEQPSVDGDGYYSVAPPTTAPPVSAAPIEPPTISNQAESSIFEGQKGIALALLAALAAIIGGVGAWLWRRRRSRHREAPTIIAPDLTGGVRHVIQRQREAAVEVRHAEAEARDTEVAAPIPLSTARIDLALDIVSASRSLMMFSVDYRLAITNRSDRALRDLAVSARLVCARRGLQNPDGRHDAIELVDRIGPHQSRSVSGQLQLPLRDIAAMRQGSTPLFIPLLILTLRSPGQPPRQHSFIVGSPSMTGAGRLHPIPLDTPPGGIPGLRAQEIKDAPVRQSA